MIDKNIRMGNNTKEKMRQREEELEALNWLEDEGIQIDDFISGRALDKIRANDGKLEELMVLTELEDEGVRLIDYISAEMLNRINANGNKLEN